MIKANSLTIEYNNLLFKDLSFTLGKGEKIGLIGLNGCGKSTLIKIIAGLETPDKGNIEVSNEIIAYLPQEYSFDDGVLVGELLESLMDNPKKELFKVTRILNKLEFSDVDWYQKASTLSYGQKMKLYLVQLMYNSPTILLLDEPTNHLDIFGIMWLENFIKNFEGVCIMVSHDREFLNSVINNIFEIEEQKLKIYSGNYDNYVELKSQHIEKRRMEFHRQESKRTRFEKMIEIIKKKNPGEAQARALKAARTRMDREISRNQIAKYEDKKIKDLNFLSSTKKRRLMLKIRNLTFGYGANNRLFQEVNLDVYGNDKIWFYGSNGIGKSTLIKLITGELKPEQGSVSFGDGIKWIYFSQDQSHMDMEQTLEEYFMSNTTVTFDQSFGILKKFLFDKDMRKVKLKRLSPGQRARLSFAVFAQHKYDLMILDEPTNHLDIRSKEIIEEALKNYDGALILVSHDRYFVKSLDINKILAIENKQLIYKTG